MPAAGTDEALGPPQPAQVIQAVGIGPEPRPELSSGPRVVEARLGLEHTHALSLVRSDEYPQWRKYLVFEPIQSATDTKPAKRMAVVGPRTCGTSSATPTVAASLW